MAGTFIKWLVPGIVAVGGGTVLAVVLTGATMTADLGAGATAALSDPQFKWTSVGIDGRDAILSGTATDQAMIDTATARLSAVRGIRAVENAVTLAEFVSPFPFSAVLKDGSLSLNGGFTDEASHAAIVAAAGDANDGLRLLSGGPDSASFTKAARFGLGALAEMDTGEVKLADLTLTIEGRAKSPAAFDTLATMAQAAPAGITLASLKVTPALAKPFTWNARFDGHAVSISGFVGSEDLAEQLRAAAPAGIAVSTNLALASGEPKGFADNTLILLRSLVQLESGVASVQDGSITISGSPATREVADAVTAAIAAIGGSVSLDPPRVAAFGFSATKASGGIGFLGFVPDAATRDRLAALPGADVGKLEMARGAPDRFASGLDFGLAALAHLSEGEFALDGARLSLTGRAATLGDLAALKTMLGEGPPQGLTLAKSDIRAPIANPFTFKVAKLATGSMVLSGYVPDEAALSALRASVGDITSDGVALADGAPKDFLDSARAGLTVLALLDAGSVSFDGTHWAIAGSVDSGQKGFAADAAYSIAGLRTAGWSYDVTGLDAAPSATLPIIAPYVWGAQKSPDGKVTFTGFAPSQAFKDFQVVKVGAAASDSSILGAGAPENFVGNAIAGLEALAKLEEGSLGLSGTAWSLTGRIGSATARAEIQDVLSGKIDPASWRVAIQSPDAAPIVTPYLWAAEKLDTGAIELSGYLPNDAIKKFAELRAGTIGRNTLEIASGEPSGFTDDVLAGLDALTHTVAAKASFDGSKWTFAGSVQTEDDRAAVGKSLAAGSQAGVHWQQSISVLMQAVAEAAAPSSEEPAVAAEPETPASEEPVVATPPESASTEPSSPEPASPVEPEPLSEPRTVSEEPRPVAPFTSAVPDIPAALIFEVSRSKGTGMALAGAVPAEAARSYFGVIAGAAPTDGLEIDPTLPPAFTADAIAAISAVTRLAEARAGFDGKTWWLRGKAADAATRDAVLASLGAVPTSLQWSTDITLIPAIDLCRETVAQLAARNAIVFTSGSATLTDDSTPALDELASDLMICPDATVHVEGHTDADGAEDINLALSVWRAEAVVTALIDRGVGPERLYAEGYGETLPIASNDTKAGKQANRRIAFTLTESD